MVRVVLHGVFRNALPKGRKRGIELDADTTDEILSALQQFADFNSLLRTYPVRFKLGKSLKRAKELTPEQFGGRIWNHNGLKFDTETIHIVPYTLGADPGTATMIAMAVVKAAIAVAVAYLAQMLFPPEAPNDELGSSRKSVLYEGGLMIQREGVPLSYVAGRKVLCGGNVIEGGVDVLRGNRLGIGRTGGQGATTAGVKGRGGGLHGSGTNYADVPGDMWDQLDAALRTVLGGKGGGSKGGRSMPNNVFSDVMMRGLIAVGAGPLGGLYGTAAAEKESSIFINEIPLRDPFTSAYTRNGVTWAERTGVLGQAAVPITPDIENVFNANQDLKKLNGGGAQIYVTQTTSSAAVSRVKVMVRYVSVKTDKEGNQSGTVTRVAVDTKRVSDSAWTHYDSWDLTGKTSDPTQVQLEVLAPPAAATAEPWLWRVYRVTADSNDDKLQNATYFNGWDEIQDIELPYDGSDGGVATALLGIAVDGAEFQEGTFPEVASLWRGRLVPVPDVYDPDTRTNSGEWLGAWKLAETDNPVWHWREIATARDCGRIPASFFNKYKLKSCADFCDEMVNGRPRYTLNKQFTDRRPVWDLLTEIAQSFGAMMYWTGSSVELVQDRPQTQPNHFITNAAVDGAAFDADSTEISMRANRVEVEWDNPDDFYRKNVEVYEDTANIAANIALGLFTDGIINKRVYKVGCTNRQEAYDFARMLVWSSQNETETLSFTTSLNGAVYLPGQLLSVTDYLASGEKNLGRIKSVTANTVTLATPVTLAANTSYKLYTVRNNQFVALDLPMVGGTTTTDTLTITGHDLEADVPVNVTAGNGVQPRLYRIITVEEKEPGQFQITGLQHHPGKYAWVEQNVPAPVTPWTTLSRTAPAPTGLTVTPSSATNDELGAQHSLSISWTPGAGKARGYLLEVMAPGDSNWRELYRGQDTMFTLRNATPGTYIFTVKAISFTGTSSDPELLSYSFNPLEGDDSIPPPVFVAVF